MGLRDDLAMQLRAAYFSIRWTTQARLAESHATADQAVLMTLLAEEPALTQRQIVERLYSDPSTVRAILVSLEKRGWVQRQSDSEDARVRCISLTGEGRKQQCRLQRVGHIGDPVNMENLLSEEELRIVTECLKRIVSRQAELARREFSRSRARIPAERYGS